MKKTAIVHPFFFSIFPVLFYISYNLNETYLSEITLVLLLTLTLPILLFFTSKLVYKESTKAGIIASLTLIMFFSFGHIFGTVRNLQILHMRIIIFFGMIIILFSCAYLIKKSKKNFNELTKTLNRISILLVLISILNIGIHLYRTLDAIKKNNDKELLLNPTEASPSKRDIYYIILDTYARNNTLKQTFGFDNTKLTDSLTKKGFYISNKSRSNFAITYLSIASSLNMQCINDINENEATEALYYKSKVVTFLKSESYKFILLYSGMGLTSYNKYADITFKSRTFLNIFKYNLLNTTILEPLIAKLINLENIKRSIILNSIYNLAEIPKIEGPKFILAHILCPHEPFIFGPNGESVQQNVNESISKQKEQYINQLIFLNKKISEVIDTILSKSKVTPIIILQGDHGTCTSFPNTKDWSNPTDNNLKERMRIFNAYLLPDGGDKLLYDSITPVNSFRLIFNYYFKTHYPLLNDQSYFSTYVQPYNFINVTEKVR